MAAKGKWFDWARLVRLPNVFTVVADILMGFLFVRPSLQPLGMFLLALFASISLYWAGMILNDVYDYEQDLRERPHRPLPAGCISRGAATIVGWILLGLGVAFAAIAGTGLAVAGSDRAFDWRPGAISVALAACVVLYDRWLKTTPLGPIAMGGCRTFNILLAMSCGWVATDAAGQSGFEFSQFVVAAAFGVYIAGVTWFARNEAGTSNRGIMVGGLLVIITGLSTLAAFPQFGAFEEGRMLVLRPDYMWPLLVLLLGFAIVRRCMVAITTLAPSSIQAAVKQCILSLIVLDAAVCLAVRSPWWWAVGILSLLVPTLALGRYFYST